MVLIGPILVQLSAVPCCMCTGCRPSCGTRFLCCWPLHGLSY